MHLTINVDKVILIFLFWKWYVMPWYHKVLINDLSPEYPEDKIILFQLHSQSNQMAEEYMGGIGGNIQYIEYELLQIYALLFFKDISKRHQ